MVGSQRSDRAIRIRTRNLLLMQEGPLCLLCGQPATDLHEWVTRKQTLGNSWARSQVYKEPALCALLCRACNQKDSAGKLAARAKVARLGRRPVEEALARVNRFLLVKIRLDWYLTP